MHMLLTSLFVIYPVIIPILQHGQRHVDQMSRMHIRYVLTREITSWIGNLVTYKTDPLNNADPEPHNKTCSAGGTILPEQELARKTKKEGKLNIRYKRLQQPTITNKLMPRPHTTPVNPCKTSHKTTQYQTTPKNTPKAGVP